MGKSEYYVIHISIILQSYINEKKHQKWSFSRYLLQEKIDASLLVKKKRKRNKCVKTRKNVGERYRGSWWKTENPFWTKSHTITTMVFSVYFSLCYSGYIRSLRKLFGSCSAGKKSRTSKICKEHFDWTSRNLWLVIELYHALDSNWCFDKVLALGKFGKFMSNGQNFFCCCRVPFKYDFDCHCSWPLPLHRAVFKVINTESIWARASLCPSFIYSWSISHNLEHEFYCFGGLGSSGQ